MVLSFFAGNESLVMKPSLQQPCIGWCAEPTTEANAHHCPKCTTGWACVTCCGCTRWASCMPRNTIGQRNAPGEHQCALLRKNTDTYSGVRCMHMGFCSIRNESVALPAAEAVANAAVYGGCELCTAQLLTTAQSGSGLLALSQRAGRVCTSFNFSVIWVVSLSHGAFVAIDMQQPLQPNHM